MGMPGIRAGYPLSERQQVALLMQMTAEESVNSPDTTPKHQSQSNLGQKGTPNSASKTKDKVNKRNERGETRLHRAAIRGEVRRIKELISEGADVNVKDFAGWTALHEACNRGYYDVAKQLLAAGAEVNTKGLDDDTPLHDASNNGHFKVVKLLLRYGGDPCQSNRRGETPLKVANSPTMLNLLLGKGTYTSSESSSESSEEEDAPSFAPSSSVDGNNTDSEFEKGLKLKGKALDPPKSTTTPVKDEYEFDEDDEEERVPPVDDKHLLKKEFRKDPVTKVNNFISIPKMEVKTYSKSNSLTPKKPVRRILSDSNSSDEDDRTLCFTPTPTPRQPAAQPNKSRDSAMLSSKQQKDKNKVKKKRKKETKNNVSKEVRFGKVNDKFCTSDSETGDLESEDDKGSMPSSNCVKDSSALNLKDSSVFNSLSASSSSSSHGGLGSQKLTQSLAEQHPKQWRTDGWKTVSSPTWSDDSSLSDSVRTRLSSESDYSSADSSVESVKQVKKKTQDNKKKNNTHANALDKKSSDFYKNSNVDGTVSKADKDGKVLKKHKVKHKHKNKEKEKVPSVVLNQDMNEKFVKSFTFDFDDSRQKSLIVETESPSESKVKLSKHDKDHFKKEDRLSKGKSEDKDWSAKDIQRVSKEEKSKKTKDSNKDRASKEEKEKSLKTEKEKGLKDKEKPKEEKQKSHKEDKKKKSKDKSLKAEKKSEIKEEKHLKSEKDKIGKEEKSKKDKTIKEETDYEEYDIKNFLDDTKMSASDDHDRWQSDLSSGSSLYGDDSWDAPMKEYKANNSVKLIVETMKEESRDRKKENKVKDKKSEHGDKRADKEATSKKKEKESSDKSNEKKKDWTDKQKLNSNHLEKEKKRKESDGGVKEKKEKESLDSSRDRKDSYEFTKERKDSKVKQECLTRDEYGSETFFKDKLESESTAKSDPRERNHSGKEKDKKGDGVEKKDRLKGEKHKDKPKDRSLEQDKDKPDKNSLERSLKDKDIERSSKDKKDGAKDKHKDSHSKDKERKMSSEQSKDKKEKISLDKHSEREKDFLEFKKEEKKPEKVREKTWYKIEDIFTDESEDENDSYNGGVAKLSDSFGLLDSHRKDSTPDRDDIDHILTDKHRKFSGEGKQHSTEKQKEKEHKDKKKEKTTFDVGKERKGSIEKHKDKKEKDSTEAKHKERKDRASVDSNQDKKNKQKPTDKREPTEEKSKSKYKDKPDHLKDRKPSKSGGENEKSLLEKLEEEAMNDYKDDSNDKNSEISSDSFTDRGHEPVLSFYDSSNDMSEDRRESLTISNPQDKFRDKERHRHSSSSSSKKSHDKEKEKVKKEKRDKSEEIRESFGRRESLPFEKEPMPLEADPYTFPYSSKADGEDDLDKTLEFEKEMSKKDKMNSVITSEKIKEKKKKEKHKEKVKEEKHKYSDGFGSFRHSKEDQKSGLKESPQVISLKDKSKEDSPKFDGKNKDRNRDITDKDRMDYNKTKSKDENDKISQSKEMSRKDSRPRELLVDGDLRLTSFGKMLSLKDQENEERHKRHKERMKQMEKLRHRSGDPKLKDKTKSTEELKKNRGDLTSKKSSSLESALKEKKLKDVGLPAQMMSPDRKSQPMDSQNSKDWLAGHQMKENLPASPRPDQNRPTGVPTPTSVISCPSFEEVMQTPRTPSCSAEDYPDIMFDGLDCQNSSAMTMSMNACSPSFFDRYSSQNSSHSFPEGTCITPAKNMQLPLVSRSAASEVRRPLEDEFKAEADKFLRQQNVTPATEFESSASHLPDDKMPLDRLECVSPPYFSPHVLSPRPDPSQPVQERASTANVASDASELPPESMFNNYLIKPSTPVHRPDPQEPCLDIAAPPTPAPAALPPMDIDDLSEPHQSEPSVLPSDPVSGSEYLPPLVEEQEEDEEEEEEDEEEDEEEEDDNEEEEEEEEDEEKGEEEEQEEPEQKKSDRETAVQIAQYLRDNKYRQAVNLCVRAYTLYPESPFFSALSEINPDTLISTLASLFKGPEEEQASEPAVSDQPPTPQKEGEKEPEDGKENELKKQEMLVQYLKDTESFALQVERAIAVINNMLYWKTTTVVQEAVQFCVTAREFSVADSVCGVRKMLPLVWSTDTAVKEAVIQAYRRLYLNPHGDNTRAKAQTLVDSLSELMVDASLGTIQCLEEIVQEFFSNESALQASVVQALWERFSGKRETSALHRRAAVLLLGMAARAEREVVLSNLDTLCSVALGEKVTEDYLLARDAVITITNITDSVRQNKGAPFRLPVDHHLFSCLTQAIADGVVLSDPYWQTFMEQAIRLIYFLAETPDQLCARLLQRSARLLLEQITEGGEPNQSEVSEGSQDSEQQVNCASLAHLLSMCGAVAFWQVSHLERSVSTELRRRRGEKEEKEEKEKGPAGKNKEANDSCVEEELGLTGASAEDTEAEFIRKICETELLADGNMLSVFLPLLVKVCSSPGRYTHTQLTTAACLALSQYMMISPTVCKDNIRLLFTVLEKSPLPVVRANAIIALGDLTVRFPNILEPWTPNLYGRLCDENASVRLTSITVLTQLVLKDVMKVKGQVSEVAVLLLDSEPHIASLALNFFNELSAKDNAIYNLLPDIISRLSDPERGMKEEDFNTIMKQLFSYITKERQTESLVEKLCQRFRTAKTERQWADLAVSLSLLSMCERGFKKLQECWDCYSDKLTEDAVYQPLLSILAKLRRRAKPQFKAQVEELEKKMTAVHTKGLENVENEESEQQLDDQAPSQNSQTPQPPKSTRKTRGRVKSKMDESDLVTPKRTRARPKKVMNFSSDEEEDEDAVMADNETPKVTTPIARTRRTRLRH